MLSVSTTFDVNEIEFLTPKIVNAESPESVVDATSRSVLLLLMIWLKSVADRPMNVMVTLENVEPVLVMLKKKLF